VLTQAIARMERFVLEGRKLNGPPAAREVNATLKQRGLEHQYVRRCYLFIVRHITPCSVATYYYYAPVLQLGALSDDVIRLTAFLMPPGLKTVHFGLLLLLILLIGNNVPAALIILVAFTGWHCHI